MFCCRAVAWLAESCATQASTAVGWIASGIYRQHGSRSWLSAHKASAETAHLTLQILSHDYLENYAFSLLQCIVRNLRHGMVVILILDFGESMHSSRSYAPKTMFTFPLPVFLTFDLVNSRLLCQLVLMAVTYLLWKPTYTDRGRKFEPCSVSVWTVGTDRHTDMGGL